MDIVSVMTFSSSVTLKWQVIWHFLLFLNFVIQQEPHCGPLNGDTLPTAGGGGDPLYNIFRERKVFRLKLWVRHHSIFGLFEEQLMRLSRHPSCNRPGAPLIFQTPTKIESVKTPWCAKVWFVTGRKVAEMGPSREVGSERSHPSRTRRMKCSVRLGFTGSSQNVE